MRRMYGFGSIRRGWVVAAPCALFASGSAVAQDELRAAPPAPDFAPAASGSVTTGAPPSPVAGADPLATLTTLGAPPHGPGADGTPLNDYWRNGLRFESADKRFSVFVGGRVQFDAVNYLTTTAIRGNIPGTTVLEDGVSFRRVRIDVGGTIYTNIDFYAQVDFANGFLAVPNSTAVTNATYPTDLWVQFKDLPVVGNVRVGNQKPLYSFEHLTSSRFLTFLERSLGFDAFAEGQNNGFEPGITVSDTYSDKRGTSGAGVFKYTRSPFGWNVGRNEAEVNGRVTYLPVYEDGGHTSFTSGWARRTATSTRIRPASARGSTPGTAPARFRRSSPTPARSSETTSSC